MDMHSSNKSIWDEVKMMQRNVDNFLRNNFFKKGEQNYSTPFTDIDEKEEMFIIKIESPGGAIDSIGISPTATGISVKAEKKGEFKHKNEKDGLYRAKKNLLAFLSMSSFPDEADKESVDTTYSNGILELTISKIPSYMKRKMTISNYDESYN